MAPTLVSVRKIWNQAPHNALTDLIRFKERWLCCFREGEKHVKGANGIIRIIASTDTFLWNSIALLTLTGVDLRDPKLSITPSGQLMLLVGGTELNTDGVYQTRHPRVAFSEDGVVWSPFQKVLEPHEWLWRVTWHKGKAYGVTYRYSNPENPKAEWLVKLVESDDGIDYRDVIRLDIQGYPNETTLRFNAAGEMIALVRRDKKKDNKSWIGVSSSPYNFWRWEEMSYHLGGPNFLILSDGGMWAGGRILTPAPIGLLEKTVLARMTTQDLEPLLVLPSAGDCSYPGMVYHKDRLWMSYYSSHEGGTAVYLAEIAMTSEHG